MKSSEKLDQLAASLYAAQRDLKNPKKDASASIPTKSGGTYRFEYTSLPALLDHIRKPLDDTGLAIINDLRPDGEYTTITHLSGQWIELGPYPITNTSDPKQRGAEQTYARRYILAGIMRIAPGDEDIDASDLEASTEVEPPTVGSVVGQGMAEVDAPGESSRGKVPSGEGTGEAGESEPPQPLPLPITEQHKVRLREFGARKSLETAREMFQTEERPIKNIGNLTADEAWQLIQILDKEEVSV